MADFETILGGIGVAVTAGALDRAYQESAVYLSRLWARSRDVPVVEHVRAILVSADELAALLDAYARPVLQVPPAVDDGARLALEKLRQQGVVLALVSNTMRSPGTTLRKLLERFGLLSCFAHTTFSDEVGVRKPAVEIFALTLRALGVPPQAAVHVGDDPVLDVHGGRAAGMRVIQVTSASLRALGAQRPDAVIPRLAALPDAVARLDGA
jgi:putative hydrolase of the HAD superfamily